MKLLRGDCLEMLRTLPNESVDSLVTDPPAGISFMGKEWDSAKGGRKEWCAWMESVMAECLRVLKPGGHGLVWAIPRTSHWTATALEDAGFEIRDCVTHLFGSGFPKSLDISKAIDKAAGAEREVIGRRTEHNIKSQRIMTSAGNRETCEVTITAPATEAAKQWAGWGTALKPAAEFWWLVRKPISEKTVAQNVQKWGTGALNIDASRIDGKPRTTHSDGNWSSKGERAKEIFKGYGDQYKCPEPQGRFPANLVLSHSPHCTDEACDMWDCPVALLDKQSGISKSSDAVRRNNRPLAANLGKYKPDETAGFKDSGGASRFFYVAKISSSERNSAGPNGHPTVKPKKLMGYLIRMITPPNGTVLDPFMGSGSTGLAAKECGFHFIGIEKEEEYFEISKARVGASA